MTTTLMIFQNCTKQKKNQNQNTEKTFFSRPWPLAYFLNGPNAAASIAPALIRHWTIYTSSSRTSPTGRITLHAAGASCRGDAGCRYHYRIATYFAVLVA